VSNTQKLFSSRLKVPAAQYIGEEGRIFYHEDTGELRISDGVTPGGLPIYFGGSGGSGGAVALLLYAESTIPPAHPPSVSNMGAIALGDGALARMPGGVAHASGVFSTSGDAQVGSYVARKITTDSAFSELYLDGISSRLTVSQNSTLSFVITVVARRTDGGQEGAVYEYRGGIDRAVSPASTRLLGKMSKTVVSEDDSVWDIIVEPDTTTGGLRVSVKGEFGKTVRWVAHIQTVEVKN
jgi:hypothetical protein